MIGEAVDGTSGLEAARTLRPDLVLLDIGLPDVEGFEVAPGVADSGNATLNGAYDQPNRSARPMKKVGK